MDLSTTYLGFALPHPLMPGASPLDLDLDQVRRLEDAGAAAIVLHSLFEEQVQMEQAAREHLRDPGEEAWGEAIAALPGLATFPLSVDDYLDHLARITRAVSCPVIASLNGATPGGWLSCGEMLQQAGADAIELNVYALATDPDTGSREIETTTLDVVGSLRDRLRIPLAVKLSPYYSALASFARDLGHAGADGLVLFNRFYQPDIDLEELSLEHRLRLSEPAELLLRLRWLAILSAQDTPPLAVTGGVHDAVGAVKAVLAGASAVQMVSALLRRGPEHLATVRRGLAEWLERNRFDSLGEARGQLDLRHAPDPSVYERANYIELLQSRRR